MTSDPATPERPRRVLYGRRFGPRLRPQRKRLLDERLPELRLSVAAGSTLRPDEVFPDGRPLWLELGFGNGEHAAAVAHAHPEIGLIGVEPFMSGVAALLSAIDEQDLTNVRVMADDARLLLDALPDGSVERIFVLFPDPWPKARHHKRRLVNADTARAMARILAPGGRLELATDHMDYARAMLEAVLPVDSLAWTATRACDWRTFPTLGHPTRYEGKARTAGRPCVYLVFERCGPAGSAKA